MKLTKSALNRIIKKILNEGDLTNPRGGKAIDRDMEKTVPDIESGNYLKQQHDVESPEKEAEKRAIAIARYRKPDQPATHIPNLFRTKEPYEPSEQELRYVRDYQEKELGGVMPSVDNEEITRSGFEEDEDTEESPYGTQYSLEDTDELYRYDDVTIKDPGTTQVSGIDYYDDEESESYEDDPPRTYGIETGMLDKVKNYFSKFLK
jgi:hypothetical protein